MIYSFQVKLGLSVSACADIKELKLLLSADTSIEEKDILLTEIDGEGFHRTFTGMGSCSSLYLYDIPLAGHVHYNCSVFPLQRRS